MFTQTTTDQKGRPLRDEASTTYTGAIETAQLFGPRLYTEAGERGWSRAEKKVVLGDGADWIWNLAALLNRGRIEKLVKSLRSLPPPTSELLKLLLTAADYFQRHQERMRYPAFRRQHLFVGSGVMEAGCKTVIRSRLKQSGMFWTVRGANSIIALRCTRLSRKFEDYWVSRSRAA